MSDFPSVLDKETPGLPAELWILNGVDGGGVDLSEKETGVAVAGAAGNAVAVYGAVLL